MLADAAILMLTARGDEYDRVLGFEVGADDYVVKLFSVRELVMRVKGLAVRARERKLARGARDEGKLFSWKGLEPTAGLGVAVPGAQARTVLRLAVAARAVGLLAAHRQDAAADHHVGRLRAGRRLR